jgi:vacuolar-type H+-ATPase subunit E/Vma4
MRSIDENIQALKRAVLNEAHAEAERIMTEAQAKAQAVRERTQAQASAERAEILSRASQEAERLRSQAIASAQLQARTAELERREKLLNSVFEAARQQIATVQQRADYDQIARDLLRQALIRLGADSVLIQADERTQAALTDQVLAEISAELGIQVTQGALLEHGIGLIAQTADGHRKYDNTLETRLRRLQNTLRAPVLRLLSGEDS